MLIFPSCKINIGLQVLSKRPDGYHDLDTVMLEIPWKDQVEINASEEDRFTSEGIAIPGDGNLILKALELGRKHATIPPQTIKLQKHIPLGAGLGGGSSDAAFVYKYLAAQYFPERNEADLIQDLSTIGSDCPFFLHGGTRYCTGKGEIMQPVSVDLSGYQLVLINLGIHISTAFAFGNIQPNPNQPNLSELILLPVSEWKGNIVNNFEVPVFKQYPELKQVKEDLYSAGALYASMTGSGSTLYGIFEKGKDVELPGYESIAFVQWIKW